MKKYEILPHTADLKIKVFGKTQEELFQNALLGMAEAIGAKNDKEKLAKRNIATESQDINALLVDFLNEVLYLTQTNKEIYTKIDFDELSDRRLRGIIYGKKVDAFSEDIKAVTYHGLEIKRYSSGLEAVIIFDI